MSKPIRCGLSNFKLRTQAKPQRSVEQLLQILDGTSTTKPLANYAKEKPIVVKRPQENIDVPVNKKSKSNGSNKYFIITFGKATTKKHKTYEDDGILEVSHISAKVLDLNGKCVASTNNISNILFECGAQIRISSKDVQIVDECDKPTYICDNT